MTESVGSSQAGDPTQLAVTSAMHQSNPARVIYLLAAIFGAACGSQPPPLPPGPLPTYCETLQPYINNAVSASGLKIDLQCNPIPGLAEVEYFGTRAQPTEMKFDDCIDKTETESMRSEGTPFSLEYNARVTQTFSVDGTLDFSHFAPWIPRLKAKEQASGSATLHVSFTNVRFRRLSRVASTLDKYRATSSGARNCIKYLCRDDAIFAPVALIGRVELHAQTASAKLDMVEARTDAPHVEFSVQDERREGKELILESSGDVVIATAIDEGREMLLRFGESYCDQYLSWSCDAPKGRVWADCEKGGLDGRTYGTKNISDWGDFRVETFCDHDTKNTGHASIDASCKAVGSEVVVRLSASVAGQGSYTDHDDCPDGQEGNDKCWTKAGAELSAGGSYIDIPQDIVNRYELIVSEFTCNDQSLLTLIDPGGQNWTLSKGQTYPINQSGKVNLHLGLSDSYRVVEYGTNQQSKSGSCAATLRVQKLSSSPGATQLRSQP